MPLFGKSDPPRQQFKLVPRPPGDTSPLELDPLVADALRKAGKDPAKFMLAPGTGDPSAALRDLPPTGTSLDHTFLFTDRSDALRCVDAFADRGRPVVISRDEQGWWVKVNSASDPTDNAAAHDRIAREVAGYGGRDHGFVPLTVSSRIRGR
jgi:hypothetical protein